MGANHCDGDTFPRRHYDQHRRTTLGDSEHRLGRIGPRTTTPSSGPISASGLAAATADLESSDAYLQAVWDAKEIVIGRCMSDACFDYRQRPNESACTARLPPVSRRGASGESWFDSHTAAHPDFEQTMLGGPDE